MKEGDTPFFVVCTGRCGTTTLVQLLRMHPKLCALNAPRPHLSVEALVKWAAPHKQEKIENKIRRKRSNLIAQVIANNYVYVEASNYSANLIEELSRLYNGKFIHLYCDGRDFVRRGLAKDWYEKKLFRYELQAWIRRKFLTDIGRTRVDHQLPPPKKLRTRLEKITWLWVEINRNVIRYLSGLPDERKFSLRLEDLDRNMLINLHKFFGVEIIPDVLDRMAQSLEKTVKEAAASSADSFEEWSEPEKAQFNLIAGEMMEMFGYN